ncbi:MAG: hypothetical protein ACYC97_12390 [Metallibacterium sp.]
MRLRYGSLGSAATFEFEGGGTNDKRKIGKTADECRVIDENDFAESKSANDKKFADLDRFLMSHPDIKIGEYNFNVNREESSLFWNGSYLDNCPENFDKFSEEESLKFFEKIINNFLEGAE